MYKDIKMVGLFLKKHYPHCSIYNVLNTLQCSTVYLLYIILFIVLYTTLTQRSKWLLKLAFLTKKHLISCLMAMLLNDMLYAILNEKRVNCFKDAYV